MPISLTGDEDTNLDWDLRGSRAEIVRLLYENPTTGYTLSDIQEHIDSRPAAVESDVNSLYDGHYITKTKGEHYLALGQRSDVQQHVADME